MTQIHRDKLTKIEEVTKKQILLKTNNYFELFSNTDLFIKMLKNINFDNPEVDDKDFKKYVIDNKIYIGLDTTNLSVDNHYLFDAFNVYYASNNFAYYRVHNSLTKAWRTTLKNTYPNSTYPQALTKVIKKELQEIIDKFNNDNADLL